MPKLAALFPALLVPAFLIGAVAAQADDTAPRHRARADAPPQAAPPAATVNREQQTASAETSAVATGGQTRDPAEEGAEAAAVDIADLDNGLVCESRRRPGSRIAKEVCYTRGEYTALAAAQREQTQRYIRDLRRDQELRADQERAVQEQQRQAMVRALGGQ